MGAQAPGGMMARKKKSFAQKLARASPRLLLAAFLFGFMPYAMWRACAPPSEHTSLGEVLEGPGGVQKLHKQARPASERTP